MLGTGEDVDAKVGNGLAERARDLVHLTFELSGSFDRFDEALLAEMHAVFADTKVVARNEAPLLPATESARSIFDAGEAGAHGDLSMDDAAFVPM